MSREYVCTEFNCRGISVSDKLAVDPLVLLVLGLSLFPVKERERVSGKVSIINQRFVNSCLANSPSVYIYTVIRTL